jgi:hypothetical protein
MSYPALTSSALAIAPRSQLIDRYVHLLCFTLVGYACLGKGFAYVGIPPLFIGEVVLACGMLVLVRSGCSFAALATLPSLLLAILMCWVLENTLPFVGVYGVDALRDSVIVGYGLFAYIVIGLLLEKPQLLEALVDRYGRFAWVYGLSATILSNATNFLGSALPTWPQISLPVVYLRAGEIAVHLSGAAVFALLGMRRFPLIWILALVTGILTIVPSRGAMLACLIPIGIAAILGRQLRRFVPVLLAGAMLFASAYIGGIEIVTPNGRSMGPRQMIENIESIVGTSDAENLDGTKTWRLRWWQAITGYTIHGPYFWTGKGSGINLAEADGFVVGTELGGAPLRSPHNAHLTILARNGVPGLALWAITIAAWFTILFRGMAIARRRGHTRFANLFLWIACYGASFLIDASFDVALEGPMLGIWFWCLFGFGIASTMIYHAATNSKPPGSTEPTALATHSALFLTARGPS